jgi:hypothetical protein
MPYTKKHPLAAEFNAIELHVCNRLKELVAKETAALNELGIPVPVEKTPLAVKAKEHLEYILPGPLSLIPLKRPNPEFLTVCIRFPEYSFHECTKFREWRLWGPEGYYYVLVADKETLDRAGKDYDKDQQRLLKNYSGLLLNRRPYDLFQAIEFSREKEFPILKRSGIWQADHQLESITKIPSLRRIEIKLPEPTEGIVIGETTDPLPKPLELPDKARDRHCYVIGRSGTGKSTLLLNMARQDIARGSGVAVIDPHGDLAQQLLDYIPEARIKDTIYLDAADEEHPIALNIMNAQTEPEISRLTDDLLVTFRRLSESWGDKMEHILGYAFETLLRTPEASFIDLKTLLTDPTARGRIVSKLTQPDLLNFWQYEFAGLKTETQPVLTRLSKFTRSSFIYSMLSQPSSPLDFYELIQSKKILLVNLASGIIGETSAGLLGSLIVSQLQLAVMRRARIPQSERTPFYLYVDEFQNFTNSTFEKILSEARKYNLCLTLAHQFISQLSETQRDAIFGNVGTKIMFGVADKDANTLKYQIGNYDPINLISLPQFTAIYRTQAGELNTTLIKTLPAPKPGKSFAPAIIEHTRQTYSTNAAPPVKAPAQERPKHAPAASPDAMPALASPKEFPSVQDKILHYVSQAEYLSTAQIIELCFAHHSTEGSKKANASRALNELVENKKLSAKFHNRKQIYFAGKNPNPTDHNLTVRDLYTKIVLSGFEVEDVRFNLSLAGTLNPDLAVSFRTEDGGQIQTYWEYDAGNEGLEVLRSKVQRYRAYADSSRICFVFATPKRLEQAKKDFGADFITYAVLEEFKSLNEPVFRRGEKETGEPFFINTPYDNSHTAISINT